MAEAMTVAVTGATGFVGRHVVRELLARGHSVRALVRDTGKATRVLPSDRRVTEVRGTILDESAPARLVEGADACVHLIGIIREAAGGQTFRRMHVEATRAIVRACEAAGVGRYLHMSALGVGPEGPSEYQKTKFEGEQVVRGSRLGWTVFRPGLIHGADGDFFGQMKGWVQGRGAPWFFMPYFTRIEGEIPPSPTNPPRPVAPTVAPVHVDDVAAAFADAVVREDAAGEVFSLCGPERLTWPQMLRAVRDAVPTAKKELKAIGIPGPLAAAQARVFSAVGMGGLLPFDAGMAQMAERDSVCSLDKARALLGFEPRPFTESMRAYAAG